MVSSNFSNFNDQNYFINNSCKANYSYPAALNKSSQITSENKISFSEGLGIIGSGFKDKAIDTVKSIINNPVKALGIAALSAAGIFALPLIGISAATGTAVLAVGFAGYSFFNTVNDIKKAVIDNKNGSYSKLRKDLHEIGGDSLDLALSLPFVPKGIRQIQKEVKYGSKIGFNEKLWNNIKSVKGLGNKIIELTKGNIEIVYNQVIREKGLKVAPELVFDQLTACACYAPETGKFIINEKYFSPNLKNILTRPFRNSTENVIVHELEHFRQFSDVARTIGSRALTGDMSGQAFYNKVIQENGKLPGQIVQDSAGKLTASSKEAQKAINYLEATYNYPTVPGNLKPIDKFLYKFKILKFIDPAKQKFFENYTGNILESEALLAGNTYAKANMRLSTGYMLNNLQEGLIISSNKK